ncbi:MOSC N-terminal beta barrel domain-containing protein [Castellaniella sp.]|uniref:MOSC N-terminal beta barrel domain-containing protein n=1 Tax=Castellaniella sp. TaxID=1955812 RepID=UPI002AFE1285|nr:MOSC N-terminal beta barrel domain-containing protein [Castellaniella sp.]
MNHTTAQPIVGASPVADERAQAYDRRWLLVGPDHACLNAEQAPGLSGLELSLRFGYLVVRAPGMLRLDIPLDVIEDDTSVECQAQVGRQAVRAVDEGDLAAAWFTQWLGQPCRLLKIHPDAAAVQWPDPA